jgi:hypothetical protein
VLKRGFSAALLVVLVPLAFMLFGFGGGYAIVRAMRRSAAAIAVGEAPGPISSSASRIRIRTPDGTSVLRLADSGPVVLKPTQSRLVNFIGVVIIALFWDGLVSFFICRMIAGFQHGHPEWFLVVFLVPFELVGIVMIGLVIHQFLALFNPRATLELSSAAIPLGGAAELRWSISGWAGRIQEFTVTLRGVEEAIYRTDRDRTDGTNRNTFHEMELCRTSNVDEIGAGSVGFVIPRDTMYSFQAENNKIIWSLDVHGDIAR